MRALFLLLVLGAAAAFAAPRRDERLRRLVQVEEGVAVALYRYRPAAGFAQRPAVLLVPDLGMGKEAFDLQGRGLAPYLAAKGRDVFVLEPRGHGQASAPSGWRLGQLVQADLPAAVRAVQQVHPGKVDLVVHGYGGTLVLAACAVELSGQVGRVVALSTPVQVDSPNPTLRQLLEGGGRISRLGLDPEGAKAFELLFARHARLPPGSLAHLRATGFSDLGEAASADLLGWMQKGDLALGEQPLLERLAAYDRPTLQLVALRNNWAAPEAATPLRELAPSAKVRLRVLSSLHYLSEDYTHLSLLHGVGAKKEIYPLVEAFLAEVGR